MIRVLFMIKIFAIVIISPFTGLNLSGRADRYQFEPGVHDCRRPRLSLCGDSGRDAVARIFRISDRWVPIWVEFTLFFLW